MGVSALGVGGAGYHYYTKNHPERTPTIAWLEDAKCVYRTATGKEVSPPENQLVKKQDDSKK